MSWPPSNKKGMREDGKRQLDGIPRPSEEPRMWLEQILWGLNPTPRFEISGVFELDDDRVAMVARVEPVCRNPSGPT